jgi:hypothetical protein
MHAQPERRTLSGDKRQLTYRLTIITINTGHAGHVRQEDQSAAGQDPSKAFGLVIKVTVL